MKSTNGKNFLSGGSKKIGLKGYALIATLSITVLVSGTFFVVSKFSNDTAKKASTAMNDTANLQAKNTNQNAFLGMELKSLTNLPTQIDGNQSTVAISTATVASETLSKTYNTPGNQSFDAMSSITTRANFQPGEDDVFGFEITIPDDLKSKTHKDGFFLMPKLQTAQNIAAREDIRSKFGASFATDSRPNKVITIYYSSTPNGTYTRLTDTPRSLDYYTAIQPLFSVPLTFGETVNSVMDDKLYLIYVVHYNNVISPEGTPNDGGQSVEMGDVTDLYLTFSGFTSTDTSKNVTPVTP